VVVKNDKNSNSTLIPH